MKEYFKKYWVVGVIACVIILALLIPKQAETQEIDVIASPTTNYYEEVVEYIYVDVKGYIKNPGVYKLDKDARLFQVITLAGGLQDEADSLAINLSMSLKDEMSIYIPSIHDNEPIYVTPEEDEDFLIDINQAGLVLLQTLPGIGPSTAQNIIDYREEYGYFDVLEDIMNVPNIGESTFEQIKDLITVEE
jgi:competence protein ComEA